MPELPEVETIRRNLMPVMKDMSLTKIHLHRTNLRFDFPPHFSSSVEGKKITNISRRAKYLLIELEGNLSIIAHLGMSGSFIIENHTAIPPSIKRIKNPRHDHVTIYLENKIQKYRVIYNDPRRFGFMTLVKTNLINEYPAFMRLGPEPIESAFNEIYLAHHFYKRKGTLKNALLNQKIVAGLGNIYACEALWRAGLSPMRKTGSLVKENGLPNSKLPILIRAIRSVLVDAINAGGSSLRDYVHIDGSTGYFQHSFSVYGRTGKACPSYCGNIIRRIVQAGRSTFYCGHCQK
ncbi:bifunctional DNA-formamidopyrimidine glycosylase/DNA-(apurinic or apyrimidinic site) lyase [Candidatus Liberibacter sp.]|uniref:bifunctional DNA-formamidopyrimidine glycosylase/DNA-(apurinic or apyrimidinic site) lyase n=1 Tax=Candidatus Liberibacter sp. TaxID=34022 RepID=UPI0015F684F2|nr:bifunctional DNA-formamidopyrimidine glycosylase/DNA-(apurinic or apyrimidinic site) lyase [Candidatus Liberibacter sp.]MBA5723695.1 bifunctional DNA-formamidopyrimidine glycosylase/DNA-(apurinic or apyrimidinic site) lyase [Candidatus Liberibacter sp.]